MAHDLYIPKWFDEDLDDDAAVAVAAPFRGAVQPNPVLAKRGVHNLTWVQSPSLLYPLPTLGRQPFSVRVPPGVFRQPSSPSSLLTTTLVPSAAPPFTQDEWPNPFIRPRSVTPFTWTLAPQILPAPFTQTSWLNPVRAIPTTIVSWTQRSLLIPKEIAPRTLFVTPQHRRAWQDPLIGPNLLCGTLGTPVVKPFKETNWPNPLIRLRSVSLLTWAPPSLSTTTLGTPVVKPFTQPDWQNPLILSRRVSLFTWTQDALPGALLALGTIGRQPFTLRVPATIFRQPSSPSSLLTTTLGAPVPEPFAQMQWPNPVRAVSGVVHLFWAPTSLATTQLVPFTQTSWSNPVLRGTSPAFWIQPGILAPPAAAPFMQLQWPNPTLRAASSVPRMYFAAFIAPPVAGGVTLWKPIWVPRRRS